MKTFITSSVTQGLPYRFRALLILVVLLLAGMNSRAQLILNSVYNNGAFTDPVSITLDSGFISSPTGSQSFSAYTFVPDCKTLGTSPSNDQNYIITYSPRRLTVSTPANPARSDCEVMVGIQYFDGLGRPMQNVQIKASPDGADIIQPIAYDQYGREQIKYLPYTLPLSDTSDGRYRANAITDQDRFYNPPGSSGTQLSNGVARITTPYSVTNFEPSPLDRVLEQGAPGDPWQLAGTTGLSATPGHTVKTDYDTNIANEVALWTFNLGGGGASTSGSYPAGMLYKTTTTDENGHNTIGFKDLDGHVVCKMVQSGTSSYLSTYYIYDYYNNLAYVVPPGVTATSFTEAGTDADFNNFIYAYHYDGRKRVTEKKIPGKGWEYIIYNTLDQVVATQDARQKPSHKWTFAKYDGQGRVIMTGEMADTHTRQQLADSIAAQTVNWETPSNSFTDGYTTSSFPGSWNLLYTVNYYDNYSFPGSSTFTSTTGMANANGLLTGSKVRVLTTGDMLLTENFYDSNGRLHESVAQNNVGGSDRTIIDYNFNDQVIQTIRKHSSSSVDKLQIVTKYTYDHMGRKTRTLQQTGAGNETIVLSKQEYNEIGQLQTRHLHGIISGSDTTYLQDISYKYNERGWLTSNTAPLFTEQLHYNDGAAPMYNGNISQMDYTGNNSGSKTFNYTYDPLDRLTAATSTGNALNESMSYDAMGNITALTRAGVSSAVLAYTYTGNQLQSVTNNSSAFRTYAYDANGNATSDGVNKTILYNYLDLPDTVKQSGSTIATYVYDANGQKLKNTGSDGTWDYDNGIVYHNGAIDFIGTEQGRTVPDSTNYAYQYNLHDHLGNNRISFYNNHGTAGLLQEDEYYSFGLRKPLYDNSNNNRYLYNGKEIQTDLANQYDYGARFYDPVIGRWTVIDPLTEKSRRFSPYNYVENNPIRNIDPNGQGIEPRENSFTGLTDWVGGGTLGDQPTWDPDVHNQNDAVNKYGDGAKDLTEGGTNYYYTHDGQGLVLNPNGSWAPTYTELSQGTQTTDGSLEALQAGINSMSAGLSLASGVAELTAYSLFPEAEGAVGTKAASEVSEAGSSVEMAIETGMLDGSFSISNWEGYPTVGGGLKPSGPFILLEGSDYQAARTLANQANGALREANPELLKGYQIHEIQPVKFGGSPTDLSNKILLTPTEHSQYTNYWNAMMRSINKP